MGIRFEIMAHKDMSGEDVIREINSCRKWLFLFDGRPYRTISERIHAKTGEKLACGEWRVLSQNDMGGIIKAIYGTKFFKAYSAWFRVEDITGYNIVDVWDGKKYIGTYSEITLKDGSIRYMEPILSESPY